MDRISLTTGLSADIVRQIRVIVQTGRTAEDSTEELLVSFVINEHFMWRR